MKYSKATNLFFLLFLPFLFTGCYTQFQTFDQYPLEDDRYSGYYSWDGFEESNATDQNESGTAYYNNGNEDYLDEQLALEEDGIYYVDYETARWYKEHYMNKMFWEGYSAGYDDGYYDGVAYYPYSARFSFNRHRYAYGYTGAYNYFDFYHYPRYRTSIWFSYGGFSHPAFYTGYFGHWGYYGPYYDGYWGHPYYTYVHVYNNYHRSNKYRRRADLYYKGPRGSGFANGSDYRTRSGSGLTRTRNSGLTRSRGVNTGVRVRSTGSSTNRGSSVGRSSGTRSRGSSVGKSRSGSKDNGRSRGSSVGRDRGSKSNGSSGSRSRSRGNNESSLSTTSVRTIDISDFNGRSYTIPPRKVRTSGYNRTSSRSAFRSFGNFLNRTILSPSSSGVNSRSRISTGNNRSSSRSSFSNRSSRKSSGSKVTRSSSSSRSSGTRSRGSSSSSKKRSRGGN